ncbi:MAG: AAA family ATPase [Bdellovibrionales bacterium]|nr:AAA family ATPase [Bdellovibrionales bacterium]
MRLLVIDPSDETRELLVERAREALRQIGMRKVEVVDGDLTLINDEGSSELAIGALLGPGCFDAAEHTTQLFRGAHPNVPVALVLDNDVYADHAVELRRIISIRMIAIADIAQIAAFILDAEQQASTQPGARNRGIVSVVHFKGGVGATTVASALASCWARHDLTVALVDFDDVNPQLTEWARAGTSQRKAVSDLLRQGQVPNFRLNELLHPVEGYDGKLVVVPQPERYQDSFHFKADVIQGAPSVALFIDSLFDVLRDEFDIIVVDAGRSWGISTFSVLPLSQQILLVTDDDGMSVRRTLDVLERFAREADDDDEFDLSRWSLVLNAYTGQLLSPKDLSLEIEEMDLFPEAAMLYTLPFSEIGRQWGGPGQSFYDLAEPTVREGVEKIAFNLVPFRQEADEPVYGKLRKQLQKFIKP